ncbi:MAG: flagellar filament capping protein FliD, partial [Phycisphaerae bacterium]
MGTISSGVGLLSGLPIRDIVDQLMAIESAPLNQLQQRRDAVAAMRTAFLELSARLLGLKSAATRLDDRDFFRQAKASSSDENVIVATAAPGATPGTYSFQVLSLVSTHQLVSSGFADVDRSPVGAGTLSFEIGYGSLSPSTPLDLLNGQRGVRRGLIRITDRSGASVDVDLTAALTVDDVLAAINSQTAVSVLASVEDDRIVLTDTTGQTLANLSVEDLAGGHAAADLGIAGAVAGDVLIGQDVSNLADGTQLDLLNDGNGVRRDGSLDDFRVTLRDGRLIDVSLSDRLRFETALAALNGGSGVRLGRIRLTDRSGAVAEVDLSGAQTVRDVVDAIAGSGLG